MSIANLIMLQMVYNQIVKNNDEHINNVNKSYSRIEKNPKPKSLSASAMKEAILKVKEDKKEGIDILGFIKEEKERIKNNTVDVLSQISNIRENSQLKLDSNKKTVE